MTISDRLNELRAWYGTVSGKLAATASMLAGLLFFVGQDPTVALFISTFLPFPLNLLLGLGLVLICYVLPHWAIKKDASNGALPDA